VTFDANRSIPSHFGRRNAGTTETERIADEVVAKQNNGTEEAILAYYGNWKHEKCYLTCSCKIEVQ